MKIVEDLYTGWKGKNRPGLKLSGPEWITIHDTANTGKGADAGSPCPLP